MTTPAPTNRDLLLPYVLPYALFVLVGAIPTEVLSPAANYAIRIALCTTALLWGRRRFVRLRGPGSVATSVVSGVVVGVLGTVLWVALLHPFAPPRTDSWEPVAWTLRVVAAVALVPFLEELFVRGYLLRLLVQRGEARRAGAARPLAHAFEERRIDDVAPGAWSVLAITASTLFFALGHAPHEWPAAVVYGLLMAGLWILRKDLLSCVVAHAVTNLALAIYVRQSGLWELW